MKVDVCIKEYDGAFIKIEAERSILYELSDVFTFKVPNYLHIKRVKKLPNWSGDIKLLNLKTGLIYQGLVSDIEQFCKIRNYTYEKIEKNNGYFSSNSFSLKEAEDFVKSLDLPSKLEIRDYQIKAFVDAIRDKRLFFLSATSSGKSLIIYLIMKYFIEKFKFKILIITETVTLVHQMLGDLKEYGDDKTRFHTIYSGQDKKTTNKDCVISTWQSLESLIIKDKKQPPNFDKLKKFLDDFDVVVVDEAHGAKATTLTQIMSNSRANYRYGFTGTTDGQQINDMVLKGLFGPFNNVISTKQLIEKGFATPFKIKSIVLKYSEEIKKRLNKQKLKYEEEIDWIVKNEKRNEFIVNLTLSLKGNTIVLYKFVDKHGKVLYNLLKNKTNRPIFFFSGEIDGEERNEIRKRLEEYDDAILVASVGTGSTGINIPKLSNLIFTSPSKARIKILQAIGRILRLHKTKKTVVAYDIADDLIWKSKENFTIKHFKERIKLYNKEGFEYKMYNVNLV